MSQHLAALERAVGSRLFVRNPGGVEPTSQGRDLYAAVTEPLDALEAVLEEQGRKRRWLADRIGVSESHISHVLAGRHTVDREEGERIAGIPDPTRENTSADGKASAVQFMRFPFTPEQKAKFRTAGTQVLCGIDHPHYGHMAVMPEAARAALSEDLA